MNRKNSKNDVLILKNGEGREYKLGPMTVVFKADDQETDEKYSISEWWLEPDSDGPSPHLHEEKEHVFYVLEGTLAVLVGENWIEAGKGTFIRIARNTLHTFSNQTDKRAGFLNIDVPGGFEKDLPGMAKWFDGNIDLQ
jgi:mannose-6-phosphate isomerase-like protein (cupin superfamily)